MLDFFFYVRIFYTTELKIIVVDYLMSGVNHLLTKVELGFNYMFVTTMVIYSIY